jgi:hypothetical protein
LWLYLVVSVKKKHQSLEELTDVSNGHQMWILFAAVFLVGGTSAGAFILSYNTPTVGLGCRTGWYMIFFIVAFVLMAAEMFIWWLTSPLRNQDQFHVDLEDYTQSLANGHHQRPKHTSFPGLATSRAMLSCVLRTVESLALQIVLLPVRIIPSDRKKKKMEGTQISVREHFTTLQNLTARNWLQRAFFTPLECCNMISACYLVFAQTVGAFNNCVCMTSSWGGGLGGYLDFTQFNVTDSPVLLNYWIQGTVISCVVMSLGMAHIVLQVSLTISTCSVRITKTYLIYSGLYNPTSAPKITMMQ